MIGLVRAETNRLLTRRMTRLFPLGMAALMIVGIIIAIVVQERDGGPGPDFVNDIASGDPSVAGSTLVLGPMGFLVPIMAFVIGASFFGADQKSGVIEQLLTWEPRRSRFLGARLLGGMPVLFVITAVLSAFLVVLLLVFSTISGTTDGAGDIVGSVLGAIVRSGITGALFFALGMAITVITNNSIASIVGFLIYAFIIENLIVGFLRRVGNWMPMENADAFVSRYGVGGASLFGGGEFAQGGFHHGWLAAGLIMAAWAALLSAIAIALFSRRDIS